MDDVNIVEKFEDRTNNPNLANANLLCPIYRFTSEGFERVFMKQLEAGQTFMKIQDDEAVFAYAEGSPYQDEVTGAWTIKCRIHQIEDRRFA